MCLSMMCMNTQHVIIHLKTSLTRCCVHSNDSNTNNSTNYDNNTASTNPKYTSTNTEYT